MKINYLENIIMDYPELICCMNSIYNAIDLFIDCYSKGGKVLLCGNGGSSTDCDHIVGELMKNFMINRKKCNTYKDKLGLLNEAFPAISLTAQSAIITAISNDIDPELIFAQQIYGYANPNDLLVVISTSGESTNCIYALKLAREMGLKSILFTGKSSSTMLNLTDVSIQAPYLETYKIQQCHLVIYHLVCQVVEKTIWSN